MDYNFKQIEKKWQDKWEQAGVFQAVGQAGEAEVLCPCRISVSVGRGYACRSYQGVFRA